MARAYLPFLALLCACTTQMALIRPEPDDRNALERRLAEADAAAVVEVVQPAQLVGAARGRVTCKVVDTGLGTLPPMLDIVYLRGANPKFELTPGTQWFVALRSPKSGPLREAAGEENAWRALQEGLGERVMFSMLASGESQDRALDAARTEATQRTRFGTDAAKVANGTRPVDDVRVMFRYGDGDGGNTELGVSGRGEVTAYRQARTRPRANIQAGTVTPVSVRDTVASLVTADFANLQRVNPGPPPPDAVMVVVQLGTGAHRIEYLPPAELARAGQLTALFELARQATKMPPPGQTD